MPSFSVSASRVGSRSRCAVSCGTSRPPPMPPAAAMGIATAMVGVGASVPLLTTAVHAGVIVAVLLRAMVPGSSLGSGGGLLRGVGAKFSPLC